MLAMMRDDTQLFKLFFNNPDFRRWLEDTAFRLAYEATGWGARAAFQDLSGMFLCAAGDDRRRLLDVIGPPHTLSTNRRFRAG